MRCSALARAGRARDDPRRALGALPRPSRESRDSPRGARRARLRARRERDEDQPRLPAQGLSRSPDHAQHRDPRLWRIPARGADGRAPAPVRGGRRRPSSSPPSDELDAKIRHYLAHDDERRRIAAAGRRRCLEAGYSNAQRLATVFEYLERGRAGRDAAGAQCRWNPCDTRVRPSEAPCTTTSNSRCPVDKTPLRRAGEAYLCDSCDGRFPVERGVVRFLPGADEFYEGRYLYTIRFVPKRESLALGVAALADQQRLRVGRTTLGAGGGDRDRDGLRWRRRVLRPPLPHDRARPLAPVARRHREPVRGLPAGGRRARDPAAGCQRRRGARLLRLGAFHAGSEAAGARGVRASASPRRQARLPVRPRLPEPPVSDPQAAQSASSSASS